MTEEDFDLWPELPEEQVRVAVLRFVKGLSVLETCQTLKITQKDVRKRQGLLYRKMQFRARGRYFGSGLDAECRYKAANRIAEHIEDVIFREELNGRRPQQKRRAT
jgi:hypothetical protein